MRASCNLLGVAVFAAAVCGAGRADISNGGFESGDFSGWSAFGPAYVREWELSRDFVPPIHDDWTPTEGTYFASLWSYDPGLGSNAYLSTSFHGAAGDVLSFDYFFDFGDVAPNYDWTNAYLISGADAVTLFEWNTPGHELGTDVNIDWTSVSYTLTHAGDYTLNFHVSDVNAGFESILGVDNVRLVPEPASATLLLAGLLSLLRRRTR